LPQAPEPYNDYARVTVSDITSELVKLPVPHSAHGDQALSILLLNQLEPAVSATSWCSLGQRMTLGEETLQKRYPEGGRIIPPVSCRTMMFFIAPRGLVVPFPSTLAASSVEEGPNSVCAQNRASISSFIYPGTNPFIV